MKGKKYTIILVIIILIGTACKQPFNTTPTENDLFQLSVSHNIISVMPSAQINLIWNEITVDKFVKYNVERMRSKDTAWTLIKEFYNPFQVSFVDTIRDDDDLIYRVGIIDEEDNIVWAAASISIPKIRSVIVPDDFVKIQDAIDSEFIDDSDEILVYPGNYIEKLSNDTKNIIIRSQEGFQETKIEAVESNTKSSIAISMGEVIGFTIKDAVAAQGSGGGVSLTGNGIIRNCLIIDNSTAYAGGGVYVGHQGSIYNSIIISNTAERGGNGIFFNTAYGELINNTIVNNDIVISGDCNGLILRNNIIYNSYPTIDFADESSKAGVIIDYSLLDYDIGFGSNNIFTNPQFIDNTEFRLAPNSPCIDAGHPDEKYNDIDGTRNDRGYTGGPRARL